MMGECAEYALQQWVRSGMPDHQKRKSIIRVNCPLCGKEVHGQAALMQHHNSKHEKKKYTWAEICRVQDEERFYL